MTGELLRRVLCPLLAMGGLAVSATTQSASLTAVHSEQALSDLSMLASDEMQGRETGSQGSAVARAYLETRFEQIGLQPLASQFSVPFEYEKGLSHYTGYNIAGKLVGHQAPEYQIVITAHYDHLGIKGGRIYNGADDNASGVAAMLALATHFQAHSPRHTLIFIATDAEENGLNGARAWVSSHRFTPDTVLANLNLDMMGNGGRRDELYVFFSSQARSIKALIEPVISAKSYTSVRLRAGKSRFPRDIRGASGRTDWRDASDHAVFDEYKIPAIFIGSHTHRHYHRPSDTTANIKQTFFLNAVEVARDVLTLLDNNATEN